MQKHRKFWAAAMLLVAGALLVLSQQGATETQAQGQVSISRFRSFGDIDTATPLPTVGRTSDRPYRDVVIGMENDLDGDSTKDTKVSLAPDVDGDGMSDIVTWRRKTRESDGSDWRGEWIVTLSSSRYDAYLNGTTISNRSGFGNVWVGGNGRYAQPYLKIYADDNCQIPDAGSDTGDIVPLVGDVALFIDDIDGYGTDGYDADGKADLGCVKRSTRTVYFLRSDMNYDPGEYSAFTVPSGVPVSEGVLFYIADVDGDLKGDLIAVEEDGDDTIFYLVRSRASNFYAVFRAFHDVGETIPRDKYTITQTGTPFFGDLDGDGKTDFGVAKVDTSGAIFKYRLSNAIGGMGDDTNFGLFNDDAPDNTGDDDAPTIFRDELSSPNITSFAEASGDVAYPVVADYDGDFVADLSVALDKSGRDVIEWRYRMSLVTSTLISLGGGINHDTGATLKYPVPGYWDADNRADIMYVVGEGVGAANTKNWNWYGGFSAGVTGNDYLYYDNNVFPSERWGASIANWQDVQPTGTVYPAVYSGPSPTVGLGTPTPTPWTTAIWGLRCYKPQAPAANGTPSGTLGQQPLNLTPTPDMDLNEISCEQGYEITPTPNSNPSGTPASNLTPVAVGGFESHQIYRINELAQTFETSSTGEGVEQRYYFNRRQFTNAWANYLDPFARMHLILYKSAFVYESEDPTTTLPDAAGLVTNEDRNSVVATPDDHYGAWYYTQDIPGAIQISMDIRGDTGCGAEDHGARVYPSVTTASKDDLLKVIWQKDKFKEWLIQHRRGPLGNPRYWYNFNLMPEVEGCSSLGANADDISHAVNAVRAYTLFLDDVRDTIEREFELRVQPGLGMFGPQSRLRDHNNAKSVSTSPRYPEGWWYGLLDETTAKESDEQTSNARLGLYIRVLRQLAAAENFNGGDLLSDVDWSPNEAKLFQEFYLYNVQDYYPGPSFSNGPFAVDGNVVVTPIAAATLQVDGENAAMSMIYTAADLYMMQVIPSRNVSSPVRQLGVGI